MSIVGSMVRTITILMRAPLAISAHRELIISILLISPTPKVAAKKLRALTMTLNAELKEDGIFAGIVTIMGSIAAGTHFDPAEIAKAYWKLYEERKDPEIIFN